MSSGYFNIGSAAILIVRYNQVIIVLTPSTLFISSFISYKRIVDSADGTYYKRFGSLFLEFKNDKGFLSTQYYFVFFIRRLLYLISQVYLNSLPFIQAGVNLGFSFIQTVYLLYYRPFKEISLFVSCISGEICVFVVLCLTTFYLGNISSQLSYDLETICACLVILCMAIQLLIMVYSFFKTLKKAHNKIWNYRNLILVRTRDPSISSTVSVDTTSNMKFSTNSLDKGN